MTPATTQRRLDPSKIDAWLPKNVSSNSNYHHTRHLESADNWQDVSDEIANYFRLAHADAIARLARVAGITLHPAGEPQTLPPPYDKYPHGLPDSAVQGMFGEVLAGLLAETCGAAGDLDWETPAHLFHTHLIAFQQLENQSQTGVETKAIFGRTGDDCLAFRRDSETHEILSVLYCEAKCSQDHDISMVKEAHEKAATSGIVDILQLIEALQSRETVESETWIDALRVLHSALHSKSAAIDRRDAVFYVHGRRPKKRNNWIDPSKPLSEYDADRPFHAVEIHLESVIDRVRSVYCPEVWDEQ